jgi:hypothetical protein
VSAISGYTALGAAVDGDLIPIVDVSDTTMAPSGTTKKITAANLKTYMKAGPVSASANPANPNSTVSLTLVMMGLGLAGCAITPGSSGKVLVTLTAAPTTLTAIVTGSIGARYGTGTAPSNGAAVTGTRLCGVGDHQFKSTGVAITEEQFTFNALLTLTPGTAYWFDVALSTTNASDAAEVLNCTFTAVEIS